MLKPSWFPGQDKMLPPSCHGWELFLTVPPPWPSSSPCPQLLFLTPHLLLMADGWDRLRGVGELWKKGTPGWASGGGGIFQGFCHCRAAATLLPPGILDGKRSGKHLTANRPADDRKQNKHGSEKWSLHLSSLCTWQIHTYLTWQLPPTCRAPQPRGEGEGGRSRIKNDVSTITRQRCGNLSRNTYSW